MKILVCGNYGMKNIGDEAILLGLRELILREIPEAEVEVMTKGSHFPVGLRSFFKALFRPSLWMKPFRLVKSCDVFLLGGGGLFTQEESFLSPVFWALQGLFASWMGKPVYCVGISIGPMGLVNRLLSRRLFKRSKRVIVRDSFSKELLGKWGVKAVLGTDPALALQLDFAEETVQEKYVVISIRPFKNIDENLYTIIAQFCDVLIRKFGLQIRLIPFQNEYKNDSIILNKIFALIEEKNKVFIHDFLNDVHEILKTIKGAEMVVGMRFHSGILALLADTPFIPLSYMSKVSNFWSEFPEMNSLNIHELSLDRLLQAYTRIWNSNREERGISAELNGKFRGRIEVFSHLFASLAENIKK